MANNITVTFLVLHCITFVVISLLLWYRFNTLYEEYQYEDARMRTLQASCDVNDLSDSKDIDRVVEEVFLKHPLFKNYHGNIKKRQTATSLMQELLEMQEKVLEKHCARNSTICVKGPKGLAGQNGGQGLKGLTGDSGDPGFDGTRGDQGPKGLPGPSGTKGERGAKGDDGPLGDKGNVGMKGDPGIRGSKGPPGDKGSTGHKGRTGPKGIHGSNGFRGLPGGHGLIGPKGEQGPGGAIGDKGNRGPPGDSGTVTDGNCACLNHLTTVHTTITPETEKDKRVQILNHVTITCPDTSPQQTVTWHSINHTYSERYNTTGNTLIIPQVLLYDAGNYRCTAATPHGTVDETVTLDVFGNSPYDCSFEHGLCGWTQGKSDNIDWTRNKGPTDSVFTGPNTDHTIGKDQEGYYMYLESSSTVYNHAADLQSPDIPPNSEYCMSFWYNMFGRDINQLNVFTQVAHTRTLLFSKKGAQGQEWHQARVTIPTQSVSFKIIIQAKEGSSYHGDLAIDDIVIKNGTC